MDTISIGEAAQLLHVSPQTLRRYEAEGKLPFEVIYTVGGQRKYPVDDLLEFKRQAQSATTPSEPAENHNEIDAAPLRPRKFPVHAHFAIDQEVYRRCNEVGKYLGAALKMPANKSWSPQMRMAIDRNELVQSGGINMQILAFESVDFQHSRYIYMKSSVGPALERAFPACQGHQIVVWHIKTPDVDAGDNFNWEVVGYSLGGGEEAAFVRANHRMTKTKSKLRQRISKRISKILGP